MFDPAQDKHGGGARDIGVFQDVAHQDRFQIGDISDHEVQQVVPFTGNRIDLGNGGDCFCCALKFGPGARIL